MSSWSQVWAMEKWPSKISHPGQFEHNCPNPEWAEISEPGAKFTCLQII